MSEDRGRVLVTGATSGIGRALALEFARRGYSLFLTGRNRAELETISAESGVDTVVHAADLALSEDRKKLCSVIASHHIEILVNNAGFGVKGDFADTSLEDELAMLEVQIAAMLELTKAVLPGMKSRRKGSILNVASVYSFSPVPQQSVYAAAKAFIYSFSSSLRDELRSDGITVSVLAPGITRTNFRTRAGIADKANSGLSAETVAKIAVEQMLRGKTLIVPGASNKIFVFLTRHLPANISAKLINFINARRGVRK